MARRNQLLIPRLQSSTYTPPDKATNSLSFIQLVLRRLNYGPESSIYTPLNKATRSIRLLRFTDPPPNYAPNLHFTLTVHKLTTEDEQRSDDNQQTRFIALSYVWGKAEADRPIFVNGQCLKIRENLYALLQVLRTKTEAAKRSKQNASPGSLFQFLQDCPYFWADAICIDQNSFQEKNHQVNMMGDIYRRAECVVSWLGPTADKSQLAMNWFRKAGIAWSDESRLQPHIFNALLDLLNRPYWQRLWVVQEFVLARRPFLLCGRSVVSLHGSTGEARLRTIQGCAKMARMISAWPILDFRSSFNNSVERYPDLYCVVRSFRYQDCEKRQDRVFALLALYDQKVHPSTWENDMYRITADYNATPEQLFYRVLAHCTSQCIKQHGLNDLRNVLNVPHCKPEAYHQAEELVYDVSGFQEQKTWLMAQNLPDSSDNEVFDRLEKLTGLTREYMRENPHGTFLEVIGRLYNYNCRRVDAGRWRTFIDVLRRILSMPVIEIPI